MSSGAERGMVGSKQSPLVATYASHLYMIDGLCYLFRNTYKWVIQISYRQKQTFGIKESKPEKTNKTNEICISPKCSETIKTRKSLN